MQFLSKSQLEEQKPKNYQHPPKTTTTKLGIGPVRYKKISLKEDK